jgi:hypothetical protein
MRSPTVYGKKICHATTPYTVAKNIAAIYQPAIRLSAWPVCSILIVYYKTSRLPAGIRYLTVIQLYNATMQYVCQPSLSVVYCSILQYIRATSTSRQYGRQPILSVVIPLTIIPAEVIFNCDTTLQCNKAISRQPGLSVVYYSYSYSILQNNETSRLPGTSRGYLTVIIIYYIIL